MIVRSIRRALAHAGVTATTAVALIAAPAVSARCNEDAPVANATG